MNKIQKIKAEIDRLQETTMDKNSNFKSQYDQGIFDGLSLIDNFIDSLEECPVSNNLEEAAKIYEEDAVFYAARRISDFFKAGANYVLNAIDDVLSHPQKFVSDNISISEAMIVEITKIVEQLK